MGAMETTQATAASWIAAGRATAWLRILAAVSALSFAALLIATRAGVGPDPWGRPLGADFVSFWTAARLALAGMADAAWNPALHGAAQHAWFGTELGFAPDYYAFFYPPPFLLICLPFGLLPYPVALAAWLWLTTSLFYAAIRALLGPGVPSLLLILAFPALTLNAEHGQNGALFAALLAAAARWLDRRPGWAGVCLGLLCCKPQLALLVLPALLASCRWRALTVTLLGGAALCLGSWAILGGGAWLGFLRDTALAERAIADGWVGFGKMVSPFAALRLLDAPIAAAATIQGACSLAALASVVTFCRRKRDGAAEIAAISAGACLATPFLLDYDLTILAIPLAIVASRRETTRQERCVLCAAYLLPLLARPLAMQAGIPMAPFVVAALFMVVARPVRAAVRSPVFPAPATARAP